jgi:hypothetical protein
VKPSDVPRIEESAEALGWCHLNLGQVPMLDIRSTAISLRSIAARRRDERRDQRKLEQELAEYKCGSARQDLYAMLSRHTAEEIAPIERILNRQACTGGSAYHH